MAVNWLDIKPNSGVAGNNAVQIGAKSHGGRLDRITTVKATSRVKPSVYRNIKITQSTAGISYKRISSNQQEVLENSRTWVRFEFETNAKYFNLGVLNSSGQLVQFPPTGFGFYVNNIKMTPTLDGGVTGDPYLVPGDPGADACYIMALEFFCNMPEGTTVNIGFMVCKDDKTFYKVEGLTIVAVL